MQTINKIFELREIVQKWRSQGATIAFVPTMGNLHQGHLNLITEASKHADKVVVSIFVNPTQFSEGEDYQTYPRTESEDEAKLEKVEADLLFLPVVDEIYLSNANTRVSVLEMSTLLCGANRPGHFDGVATIVLILFNIVMPDYAFFGEKDYQQLKIIRKMVQDLNLAIEIKGVSTIREADGLAMSSRNNYLTDLERKLAPELYRSLCDGREKVLLKQQSLRFIEQQQYKFLIDFGYKVDYFSICRQSDLTEATMNDKDLVILVAAKLGSTRLIDNVYFSR